MDCSISRSLRLSIMGALMLGSNISALADTFTFDFTRKDGDEAVTGRATLTVTPGSNVIGLVLANNTTNTRSVGQGISGFSFAISGAGALINVANVEILSQTGREVRFDDSASGLDLGGTSSPEQVGWGLIPGVNTINISALGFVGPAGTNPPDELILGQPDASTANSVTYSNANASITHSGPHQPFVVQSLTLSLKIGANWQPTWTPSGAQMFFGTTPSSYLSSADNQGNFDCAASVCVPQAVPIPEPSSFLLFGTGAFGVAWLRRIRTKPNG